MACVVQQRWDKTVFLNDFGATIEKLNVAFEPNSHALKKKLWLMTMRPVAVLIDYQDWQQVRKY